MHFEIKEEMKKQRKIMVGQRNQIKEIILQQMSCKYSAQHDKL